MVRRKKHGGGYGKDADDCCGDGGLWQRSILMGDKCQPLDFSGVIHYDSKGNQLDKLPVRSTRRSPLPGYSLREGLGYVTGRNNYKFR
ncbi:putative Oleosin [Hibiscus syriacus]|uniref:Oleosin n=1 Tax=Hibiscus syriacus TaxID=106335 RepID=A0A6A2X537_HIBSY|nr:putative Oleosin [Hibiscus syriacus]